ncbi:MAG: LysR family transcriptional regulator [Chordicoccus sp.]
MDIGKYEIFADVAETKNFTKTGDRLGYTQPAVSRTLKMLERDMGFPLFIRGSSGVKLTDEATRILPFVYRLLADNNRLIQKISDINGLHTGHLSIACFSSISRSWLPHMLALFRQEYPGISVELMEGGTDDIVGWVTDNIADFGLLSHRHTGSLEWISLYRDPLVAVLPRKEPYLSMSAFPIEEMNSQPFILSADGTDYDIHHVLSKTKIRPEVRYTSKDDHAIVSLVAQGLGLSILPKLVVEAVGCSDVRIIPLTPSFERDLGIAYKDKASLSPAARKFIDRIDPPEDGSFPYPEDVRKDA